MLRFLELELMILINYNYHGYLFIDTFWKYSYNKILMYLIT
jgi:hypothetical protein